MLSVARKRAAKLSMNVSFSLADAEALPFPDKSFDTVVSSLTTCTFPNPVAALKEMARVCRPGGRILLVEHGRSNREWLGRWQDRREESFAKQLGCHWNREPLELVRKAGLKIIERSGCFSESFMKSKLNPHQPDGPSSIALRRLAVLPLRVYACRVTPGIPRPNIAKPPPRITP
jgi:SAM-dependent methyltransferase